ncbi:MAG TPA: MFS transporter, partial [Longimicrobiaceae bacterium]|nr:MFS transporter [Longimicrobiaceae bacterium]
VQLPGAPPRPRAAGVARGALAALRHRNFRLFYFGHLLSMTGTWVQSTAQGWLVLELTDSALLLGTVTAAGALPVLLFTLYAGVVADRMDKRRIIVAAQAAAAVLALALALLTDTGRVTVAWIMVLVFLLGTANAFEIPTRQSFFVDLVGEEDLTNAIALNSTAFSATRVVGPAVAGVLLGSVGIAACFYLNSVSYLAVLAGLLAIRLPPFRRPERTASTLENLREGFGFIRGDRVVRTLVWMIAALSVFGFPYAMLLPVFARDVLHVGAQGLGWLLAASGAGALAGGITLSVVAGRVRRGPLVLGASFAFALAVGAFAFSRAFPLSLLLLAAAGFCMILNNSSVNALLQSLVPNRLRGRVMSVYVFMFLGMTPVGSLQAGALARWVGAPAALAMGAATLAALVLLVAWKVPELRELR